jgi:hypothetical protein
MPMVFLEWSIRKSLDIVTSGLVAIYVGDIWVGLGVLHSNGFEWSCHSGIGHKFVVVLLPLIEELQQL